jgi:two-component system nitrogen regulation response regulator GlnG
MAQVTDSRSSVESFTAVVPALVDELLANGPGRLYRDAVLALERPLLAYVLAKTGGNQLRAARVLGLNRNTLRKRCRALKLETPGSHSTSEGAA